ncbi:MAG: formate dehydrogenase subunit gamma [Gammaproteobacteria bacterium]|nr:formate dehydrogenase subunit gamma [Gammaproteobacteria bacterium]
MSTAPAPAETAAVRAAIARHSNEPGPLLEILHAVQGELGYVPPGAVAIIATALNLSRAEVHGAISFYHHFRHEPAGRQVLRICRAEACQAAGGGVLQTRARETLGVDFGRTTADGRVTLEAVYCLGLCACAPAVMLDGEVHGRVTPARLDELLGGSS